MLDNQVVFNYNMLLYFNNGKSTEIFYDLYQYYSGIIIVVFCNSLSVQNDNSFLFDQHYVQQCKKKQLHHAP